MSIIAQSKDKPFPFLTKLTNGWFGVVFTGQLIFAIYILLQYIVTGIMGNLERWGESSTGGYVAGDGMGNFAFGIHVLLAGIVTIGGPLQLIPQVRNRYLKFHRINGRVYIIAAYIISIVGLYLMWVRGTVGDTLAHTMTSINGLIIIVAATYTFRKAIARNIKSHQQWAIRLFLAMSGVYFFRVLLNCWLVLFQDTGIDFDSFTGPALDVIGFCSYIAPQIIAEWYFRVSRGISVLPKRVMVGFLALMILIFCVGTVGAVFIMWWPAVS